MPICRRFCSDTALRESIGFSSMSVCRRCNSRIPSVVSDSSRQVCSICDSILQSGNRPGNFWNRLKRRNSFACCRSTARNRSRRRSPLRLSQLADSIPFVLRPISLKSWQRPYRRHSSPNHAKNRQRVSFKHCESPSIRNSISSNVHWTTFCTPVSSRAGSRSLSVFIHSKTFG